MNEYNIVENGMTDMLNKIQIILQNDEPLLRLLYYYPADEENPDPLDPTLPDVLDMENKWDIIDERIQNVEKTSDLDDVAVCRVLVTPERDRPVFGNFLLAKRGVSISIITHELFEKDGRMTRISDRINHLLTHEYVGALGKIDYVKGDPRVAPREFYRYNHVYEYMTMKKV